MTHKVLRVLAPGYPSDLISSTSAHYSPLLSHTVSLPLKHARKPPALSLCVCFAFCCPSLRHSCARSLAPFRCLHTDHLVISVFSDHLTEYCNPLPLHPHQALTVSVLCFTFLHSTYHHLAFHMFYVFVYCGFPYRM